MGWRSGGGGDGAAGDCGESDDAGEMNLWHWQSHRTGSRSRRRRSTSLSDFIEGGEAEGDEVRDGLISKHGERQQFVGPFSGPDFSLFSALPPRFKFGKSDTAFSGGSVVAFGIGAR